MGNSEAPVSVLSQAKIYGDRKATIKKKTLGLNIIVGPKEENELSRCLESCKGPLFDEIIVTITSDDEAVKKVAEKYATKVPFFKWVSDFSAARNYSFEQSTTDYILWCFHSSTKIVTPFGLREIKDIKIGDEVLTHTGHFKKVVRLYERPYKGDLYRISTKAFKEDILVTDNHEFYASKGNVCKTGVKFCKPDCVKQWSKRYLKKYGKLSRQCKQGYTDFEYKYIPISELNKGDLLSFPKYLPRKDIAKFIDIPQNEHYRANLPERVEVTPGLMRLFGYFVAEGCTGGGVLNFNFHLKEKEYHDDVLSLMSKYFNLEGSLNYKYDSNSCVITYCSKALVILFEELFNGLQPVRRLPRLFFDLSLEHIKEFIKGYYNGDGGQNPDSFAITSSSYDLINQVRLLLSGFGIFTEILLYKTKKAWKLRCGGKQLKIFENITNDTHNKNFPTMYNKNFYCGDDSCMHYQIEDLKTEHYEGSVFNLEVEDAHTYVANYALCHNCDADDVIKPSEYQKLLELKEKQIQEDRIDVYLLDYIYFHDDNDNPAITLPRERIVRNCKEIRWHDTIHEYLDINNSHSERFPIKIDHYRVKPYDPARNIPLLEKQYNSPECTQRNRFYYGKELSDNGQWGKAIPILEDYLKRGSDFVDNMAVAAIKISQHYYHTMKDYETAKRYAFMGIGYNGTYAENFVTLGDAFLHQGNRQMATTYFKEALKKPLQGGMSQIVEYYGLIPAAKLAIIYMEDKSFEEALSYADKALSFKPDDSKILEVKRLALNELNKLKQDPVLTNDILNALKGLLDSFGLECLSEENYNNTATFKVQKKSIPSIAWLVPQEGDFDPAIRLRRLNIHAKLVQLGIKSKLIRNYYARPVYEVKNELSEANVVVFSQFGEYDLNLMKILKGSGKKIIRDHCEGMFGFPFEAECFNAADAIVCASTKLEEMTKENGFNHTRVIKDAVEERYPKEPHSYEDKNTRPRAVFMGGGGNGFLASEVLKPILDRAGYDLVMMTEWDNADIKWDLETWPDDFCACDVSLCPQRVDVQPAKSNVKATAGMGLGMPVIASPLQSYLEVINNGKNGYICYNNDEWYSALIELKDPVKRKEIGEAAKRSVGAYILDSITNEWVTLFKDLLAGRFNYTVPEKKEVKPSSDMNQTDIIIPNYNNLEYLKLCLNSIMINTLTPYRIIISDAGSNEETWEYLKTLRGITVLGATGERKNFSETCNAGINASNSKYFVILNSDVVVSKDWLRNMIQKMDTTPRLASCGVLSNCDLRWLHGRPGLPSYKMRLDKAGIDLVPGMKMETIQSHLEELYGFMESSNKEHAGKFTAQQWVAAYATIFARCAITEIGMLDTNFNNGCEDLDLMIRLSKCGYVSGQAIDAFVFHFGGISRSSYERELDEKGF